MSAPEFTISIERVDGLWVFCPLGDYPDGLQDLREFADREEAKAWFLGWADDRRLHLEPLGEYSWRVVVGS